MCGCEHHWNRNAPCTCRCPGSCEQARRADAPTAAPYAPLVLEISQGRILVTRGTTQIPVEPHEVDEMCRNLKLLGDALQDAL